MPLPSVFQGVQDCRLPALKPPKPSRRPPRQQLLQLHAPAICFSGGSRQVCLASNHPNASAGFQGNNSYSYTVATTCPCHLFFRGFKTAVCPASNPPNASNPPAGLQGNNSYSYYMPLPSVFQGVQDCRLPALKPPKPSRRPPRQQLLQLHAPAIDFIFQGVQDCRLPGLKPSKRFRRLPRQQLLQLHTCPCHLFFRGFKPALTPSKRSRRPPRQPLLQLHAPAICFSGGSRLPFARPLNPLKNRWQGHVVAVRVVALEACGRVGSVWGVWGRAQPSRRPPRQQLLQLLHAPAICFSGGSRLPFARPQTPQTLPQASQATTLTATCPCHRFYFSRGSRLPFAWPQTFQTLLQASKATTLTATYMPLPSVFQGVQARPHTLQTLPQASKATTLTATCPCHLFFRGFTTSLPGLKPSTRFRRLPRQQLLQLHCSYYMPLPSVFQGIQDCRLPALKPPKPSRRPPRQQLLQLHAPTICFSGGSRQVCLASNPPNASAGFQGNNSYSYTVATTCPCHLFFRGFKTAVCPASNPPNASNPPAGLQGNNSVWHSFSDCLRSFKRFDPMTGKYWRFLGCEMPWSFWSFWSFLNMVVAMLSSGIRHPKNEPRPWNRHLSSLECKKVAKLIPTCLELKGTPKPIAMVVST